MANVKISALSAGTTPDRTEVVPAVQGAATVKFTVAQILGAILDADIPASIARDSEVTTVVNNAVSALVASAPSTLDTLNELATALGSDPNFATTMTTALAGKSATGHTHAEANVTNLVTDLAGKASTSHHAAHEPGGGDAMAADASAATASLRTLGTGAAQAAAGDHTHAASADPSFQRLAWR